MKRKKTKSRVKIACIKQTRLTSSNNECPEEEAKYFIELGKKVATANHYFDIGAVYAIQQSLKEIK